MKQSDTRTGVFLSLACLVILGTLPVVANSRPPGTGALAFSFFLSVWQLAFALPLFVWELNSGRPGIFKMNGDRGDNNREKKWGKKRESRQKIMRAFGVMTATGIMFGLATWCYVLSVDKAGTVTAAIAIQAYPLFAILAEMILIRKGKSLLETVLTVGLVADLYYLGTGGTWEMGGISGWFLAALAVPLLWSIAHVLIREELTHTAITPAQVTFFRVLVSTLFLGIVLAATGHGFLAQELALQSLPFAAAMGGLYYLELLVWFHAVGHIPVSLASAVTTPWPVVTMVLAALFLGDKIQGYQIIAFCIAAVCIGALLAAGVARQKPRNQTG